jgi:hypothetical protein
MAKKNVCAMCGKDIGMMSPKIVLQDGVLCSSCGGRLPKRPMSSPLYTLEEAENILQKMNEREEAPEYTGTVPNYVVLQVVLKEALIGTGSANLPELEGVINRQAAKGYRLHTFSTTNGGSKGLGGGDRIQATLVFEKILN